MQMPLVNPEICSWKIKSEFKQRW